MPDIIPHDQFRAAYTGEIIIGTHTFRVALFTSSATVGVDNVGLSDLGANEVANGNGYTTGGQTIVPTVADNDTDNRADIDLPNITFTASGGSIGPFQYAVLYDDTHASDIILYILDAGTDITITDGNSWTATIDATGLYSIAQAA